MVAEELGSELAVAVQELEVAVVDTVAPLVLAGSDSFAVLADPLRLIPPLSNEAQSYRHYALPALLGERLCSRLNHCYLLG